MNPEIMDLLVQLAVLAVSAVVTIGGGLLTKVAKDRWNIDIDDKHTKALHEAARTWAEDAVQKGVKSATTDLASDFLEYASSSVPDAINWHKPARSVAAKIARRYFKAAGGE